jgi:hypothetical protein
VAFNYNGVLYFFVNNSILSAKEYLISKYKSTIGLTIISEGSFTNAANLDAYQIIARSFASNGMMATYYAFHKDDFIIEGIYVSMKGADVINDRLISQTMYSLQFEP